MITIVLLPVLLSLATGDNSCYRAKILYPNSSFPVPRHVYWPFPLCPISKSCCSSKTEQEMMGKANKLTDAVYKHLDHYISLFHNHTMMPLYFIPDLDQYTFKLRDFRESSYQDVLYVILRFIVPNSDTCIRDENIKEIEEETLSDVVNITNHIYALQVSLDAIYETLRTVRGHNLTYQCVQQVIRNGISTNPNLDNDMCPVCIDESSSLRTCKSLCINTIRGCFGDVTTLLPQYEELLRVMDKLYVQLKYILVSRYGSFNQIILTLRQLLDYDNDNSCVRDNPFAEGFKDNSNFLNKFPTYYTVNKGLSGILSNPDHVPCALSQISTERCWTGRDGINFDSDYVRPYTFRGQKVNPILPLTDHDPNPFVVEANITLTKALELTRKVDKNDIILTVESNKNPNFSKNHADNISFFATFLFHFAYFALIL